MKSRILLMCSMALNALLIVAIGYPIDKGSDSSRSTAKHVSGPEHISQPGSISGGAATYEYWLPSYVATARLNLIGHGLGPDASALNAGVPKPSPITKSRYSFLADEKLVQLEAILLNADRRRAKAIEVNSSLLIGSYEQEIAKDVEEGVVKLLNSQELLEYRMRDSALAQQLLATGFIFTEPEFRTVFIKLAAVDDTAKSGFYGQRFRLDANALTAIQEELSAERGKEFRRLQDPAYRALAEVATTMGLRADEVDTAYEAIERSREVLRRAGPTLGAKDAQQGSAVRAAIVARDQVLTSILGEAEAGKLATLLNLLERRRSIGARA